MAAIHDGRYTSVSVDTCIKGTRRVDVDALYDAKAYRPRIATPTLAAAFVEPALAYLKVRNGDVRFNERLRALTFGGHAAAALEFPEATLPLQRQDAVILAVPPLVAKDLVPNLTVPLHFRSIVNAHFQSVFGWQSISRRRSICSKWTLPLLDCE